MIFVSRCAALGVSLLPKTLVSVAWSESSGKGEIVRQEEFDYSATNLWDVEEVDDCFSLRMGNVLASVQVGVKHLPMSVSPLIPLSTCVGEALARIGEPEVTGYQVIFPSAARFWDDIRVHSEIMNWFLPVGGGGLTVQVVLDGGASAEVQKNGASITEWFAVNGPTGLRVDRFPGAPEDLLLEEIEGDEWRLGRGHHPVSFLATIPEWSFEAFGCLAAWMQEACRVVGMEHDVLMSVVPADR